MISPSIYSLLILWMIWGYSWRGICILIKCCSKINIYIKIINKANSISGFKNIKVNPPRLRLYRFSPMIYRTSKANLRFNYSINANKLKIKPSANKLFITCTYQNLDLLILALWQNLRGKR
jgi:hypothetical protein